MGQMAGVGKTSQDIFCREFGVVFQKLLECLAGSQEFQDQLYGQPSAAHDWFSAENFRINFDSLEPIHNWIIALGKRLSGLSIA